MTEIYIYIYMHASCMIIFTEKYENAIYTMVLWSNGINIFSYICVATLLAGSSG